MIVQNAAGRNIETNIGGKMLKPFAGAKKYCYSSKVEGIATALKKRWDKGWRYSFLSSSTSKWRFCC